MSDESSKNITYSEIEELFGIGTVMIFKCAARSDFPLWYVSSNAEQILGFTPEFFTEEQKNGWSSRVHPDDRERVLGNFQLLLDREKDSQIHEYRFKRKDGKYIWLRDEIKYVNNGTDKTACILGTSFEITTQKQTEVSIRKAKENTEEDLKLALSFEKVISECSNLLLSDSDRDAVEEVLELLRKVLGADRAYIFENQKGLEGQLLFSRIHEVCSDDLTTQKGKKEFQDVSYEEYFWFRKTLSGKSIINQPVSELPMPERGLMEDQNVKSVLILPVFVNQDWYGFIGFDDTENSSRWKVEEVDLLKTATEIIGSYKKRQEIQNSLIHQRNLTQAIIDSLPGIFLMVDENQQFLRWNENLKKVSGYNDEELAGLTSWDFLKIEDLEYVISQINRVKKGKSSGTELEIITKDGSTVPYFWRSEVFDTGDQKLFLTIGVDITKRKEVENELLDEKRFNEAIMRSLPGIFYMLDEQGRYVKWNENFVKEIGYADEEIREMNPLDFYKEEDHAKVEKKIAELFETGSAEAELYPVSKSGEEIPYYLKAVLFKRGGKNYMVGTGYDVSEQKEILRELKRNEEFFRNLFLKSPAAIIMVDAENYITRANDSFEELFGYAEEEILGKNIDELVVPEEEFEEAPSITAEKGSLEIFHREAKRIHKDGHKVEVYVAGIPVYLEGKNIGGFGMYIDMTDQKKNERELKKSLLEKQILLQEIHHRVKNNLAIVSSLLQLQIYEEDDRRLARLLQESQSRIKTMALIHEKLYNSENLSRINLKSYINELIDSIKKTFNYTSENLHFKMEVDDVEMTINKAIPFALFVNEVVSNSLEHAFNNRAEGMVTIQIKVYENDISALIADDGIGIDDKGVQKGGLGMTLIKNLLRQLQAEWEMNTEGGVCYQLSFNRHDTKGSSSILIE